MAVGKKRGPGPGGGGAAPVGVQGRDKKGVAGPRLCWCVGDSGRPMYPPLDNVGMQSDIEFDGYPSPVPPIDVEAAEQLELDELEVGDGNVPPIDVATVTAEKLELDELEDDDDNDPGGGDGGPNDGGGGGGPSGGGPGGSLGGDSESAESWLNCGTLPAGSGKRMRIWVCEEEGDIPTAPSIWRESEERCRSDSGGCG